MKNSTLLIKKLKDLCDLYSKNLSPTAIDIYVKDLNDFSDEDIEYAFSHHRRDPVRGRFFPSISNIIAQIERKYISIDDISSKAWDEVYLMIKNIGRYGEVIFKDEITKKTVEEMGGFKFLCDMKIKDSYLYKKDFCMRYLKIFTKNAYLNSEEHKSGLSKNVIEHGLSKTPDWDILSKTFICQINKK